MLVSSTILIRKLCLFLSVRASCAGIDSVGAGYVDEGSINDWSVIRMSPI